MEQWWLVAVGLQKQIDVALCGKGFGLCAFLVLMITYPSVLNP